MRAEQCIRFSNIAANTNGFTIYGGKYQTAIVATFGGGSVGLQQLGPDGTTWLIAATAVTANGVAVIDLTPGVFRFAIVTATGVFITLARIPGD